MTDNLTDTFQSAFSLFPDNEPLAAGIVLFRVLSGEALLEKAGRMLHPEELERGVGFASDIRRRSFLHGRIAGKMAANMVFPDIPPVRLNIETGCLGEPLLANAPRPYGVSIAHDAGWNAGLCFPLSFRMGIDVESISEKNREIIAFMLTPHEKELCNREKDPLDLIHLLWTVKEAAGKALGLGFRVPADWYETDRVETVGIGLRPVQRCLFKHLTAFNALAVAIPGGMAAVAYPAGQNIDGAMTALFNTINMPAGNA